MAGPTHLLGQSLGRYLIQSVIGSGGFATVYRAVDTTLERPVALKVVDPAAHRSPTIGRRFVLEGRAVASLNHTAIVPVYDAGESDGVLWLAMRLIEGSSLDHALVSGRRFTAAETLAVIDRIGAALDHAHTNGVVHRDVKPSNILLGDNQADRAWLTDFGIAATARTAGLYTTGALGTAAYMAPEQSKPSEVGPPADLYSLGCVAYEMLTGQRPFPGDDYVALLLAHATEPVPSTGQQQLDDLMARAMAKQPGERPRSGADLTGQLRSAVQAAPSELPPESPIPLRLAAAGSVPTVVADDHPGVAETVDGGPQRSSDAPPTLAYPTAPMAGPAAPPPAPSPPAATGGPQAPPGAHGPAPGPAAPPAPPAPGGSQPPAGPGPIGPVARPGATPHVGPAHRAGLQPPSAAAPGAPPAPQVPHVPHAPGPPGAFAPGGLAPPRDPTVVRTSRRRGRQRLVIGGLVLLAAGAAAVVTLVDMRGGGGGGGDTELIRDGAGVTYRVPTSWVGDDDNPPLVRWSEGDIVVAEITHASSDQVDAVAALQDAEPARCADLATRIDVVGADDAARCDNPDDTEAPAPATAVGVLADGELWLISLDRSLSSEVRDDFVDSLDFG